MLYGLDARAPAKARPSGLSRRRERYCRGGRGLAADPVVDEQGQPVLEREIVHGAVKNVLVALLGAGAWGIASILPFGMAIALTGLEFLVAGLQAFVFAVLTCVYLHDAMHPGH